MRHQRATTTSADPSPLPGCPAATSSGSRRALASNTPASGSRPIGLADARFGRRGVSYFLSDGLPALIDGIVETTAARGSRCVCLALVRPVHRPRHRFLLRWANHAAWAL